MRTDLLREAVYHPVTESLKMDVFVTGYLLNDDATVRYITKDECGTAGCICGNIVLHELVKNGVSIVDTDYSTWGQRAASILEVDLSIIRPLFYVGQWPHRLKKGVFKTDDSWEIYNPTPEQIKAAVEDFIQCYLDGEPWGSSKRG